MAYQGFANEEVPEIDLTLRLGLPIQNDHRRVIGNASNMNHWAIREFAGPSNFVFNVDFVNQQLAAQSHALRSNNIYINNNNYVVRTCKLCGTNDTPLWRKGPQGRRTLCNACGLKFLRAKKKMAAANNRREGEGGEGANNVEG